MAPSVHADSAQSSSDKSGRIPQKIRWLHENLPWRRFMMAESLTVLGISVAIIALSMTIQQASLNFTPPCRSEVCERALTFTASSVNKKVHPCENFYHYVCGNWKASNGHSVIESSRLRMVERVYELLGKITVVTERGIDLDALSKLALYYQSCRTAQNTKASYNDGIQNTLSFLKLGWEDFVVQGSDTHKATAHIVTMSLVYGFDMGIRLLDIVEALCIDLAAPLMKQLHADERILEDALIRTLKAGQVPAVPSTDIQEVVAFDKFLVSQLKYAAEKTYRVGRPAANVFAEHRPLSVWKVAIKNVSGSTSMLLPGSVVYSKSFTGVEKFTQAFLGLKPLVRTVWIYVHTVITPLEIVTIQMKAETTNGSGRHYCYEAIGRHDFGLGLEMYAAWASVGMAGYGEVMRTVELLRARMSSIMRYMFKGDLAEVSLAYLGNLRVIFLLGAVVKSRADVEKLFRSTYVGSDFYRNRLQQTHPLSVLVEQYSECLEKGGTLIFYTENMLCIWAQGVSPPFYYGGAEPIVNFPTFGFLVSSAFVSTFFNSLFHQREGSNQNTYEHFLETAECLINQYTSLSNAPRRNTSRDDLSKVLLILSGSLQLAYDTLEASSKFKSNLERQMFFVRYCTMFCTTTPERPVLGKQYLAPIDMCNIIVRNVLTFYQAFQCFPEDYMGNTEVCRIFSHKRSY